ncbi:MAG: thiamine biosynthesis protein ApbE [Dehalococcoidia bacterium]|nr:thiamine biosynthesis protein ApbE [Dehalococcoidia bacterium]
MTDLLGQRVRPRQLLRITAVTGISLALGGGLVQALVRAGDLHRIRETRTQLGTLVTISVVHPDPALARQMVADAFAEMERLEGLLSRHRTGTPISRLNHDGVVRGVPAEVVHIVRRALQYSVQTVGAFDITVTPLLELYSASFARTGAPPSGSQVQEALSRVGYHNILVDDYSIAFKQRGVSITLDGIGKGYIVDRAVGVLKEHGADQVLVDAGGDMGSVRDGSQGEGWRVAIEDPRAAGKALETLQLAGASVATSGDYLQCFTADKLFHHILDPRTGRSPEHTSAVTIVAPTAMEADALSTATMVLGPQDGLRLLARLDDVEGVMVTKEQEILRSRGMSRYTVG